jgi:hypothetical protein
MEARELISEMAYGPETLKLLYQAFDAAWESIAPNVGDDPQRVEIARIKLANAVLSFPIAEVRSAEQVKKSSLQIMALQMRNRPRRSRVGVDSTRSRTRHGSP